ncbi:MAG: PHP domain-containing protein, partial [Victivallales bacterium]|nr:PHP domain-containing protein [Victivallales bacterium]
EVHSHTNYSDGTGTPGGLMAEAALCGMDFLVITDHGTTLGAERLADALAAAGNRFPLVVGEELTLNKAYHLNFFPLQRVVSQEQTYRELLADAHGQGAVVMLNHPMTYGTNLRKFWYGDFRGTGLDAVERRIEYLDRWRAEGTAPVVLGSTDTHAGIFGNLERSVVLADEPSGPALADAIRNRKAGMLAPNLPQYIVADAPVVEAVRAALADPELPALHARRLANAFADTDFAKLLQLAPDGTGAHCTWGDGNPDEVILPLDD